MTQDFSAQISAFKQGGAQIVTGVVIPPDAKNFLVAGAAAGVQAEGHLDRQGAAVPDFDRSARRSRRWSLDRSVVVAVASVQVVADGAERAAACRRLREDDTSKQWTQPIGFAHALFEIAVDALKRAKDIDSNEAIRDAVASTKLDTVVGHVAWGSGPVKNVAKTPLVGGQWVKAQRARRIASISRS